MKLPESLQELVAALDLSRADRILHLDVDGCSIEVATNDDALRASLARYFREIVTDEPGAPDFRIIALESPVLRLDAPWRTKDPEPGKRKVKEQWVDLSDGRVIRKTQTDMVFAIGGEVHLAYGPCRSFDNQIVNFVNNRYIQWRLAQGYLLAHAGAVSSGGRCLALCGPSGSGKSTCALDLVASGLDFVSNDRLLFRAGAGGVEVYGIPKHPRVNPGTILNNPLLQHMIAPEERSRLRALPDQELRALEDKYDVLIDHVFGRGRFRMAGSLDALVVFNWSDHGTASASEIDLAERPELLPLITKSPGLFYESGPGQPEPDLSDAAYLSTLEGVRVVEITGRQDFTAARRLCQDVLGQGVAEVG